MKKIILIIIVFILIILSLFICFKINKKTITPIDYDQNQEDYNDIYNEYFNKNIEIKEELPKIVNGYLYTLTGNKILLTKIVKIKLCYIDVGGIDFPEAIIWYRDDKERLQMFSIPYKDYVRLGSFPYYREMPNITYN